jgi:hypothetical protein
LSTLVDIPIGARSGCTIHISEIHRQRSRRITSSFVAQRPLGYGVKDVSSELLGRKGRHDALRKNEFWAVDDVSFELRRGNCDMS